MKTLWKKTIAVMTAGILSLTPVLSVAAQEYTEEERDFYGYYINAFVDLLELEYKFEAPKEEIYKKLLWRLMEESPELLEELIATAADMLDENTAYFTRDELKGFLETTSGSYVGIGVSIQREKGYVVMTAITPNSPAEQAGILPGDKIVSIDGEDATAFDVGDTRDRIRGEEGTQVTLGLLRGEESLTVTVTRQTLGASPVAWQINEDKTGYIDLAQFNDLAVEDVKAALQSFDSEGVTDIVVDLRDNPGGYLQSVISILELFVPKDMVLVNVDFKDDRRDQTIQSSAAFTESKYNLVVLINGGTASAAEVFTGCILDNKLGVVIGEKSYGKATIQEFMNLKSFGDMNLGDVKLTVGEYRTPNGLNIHHRGISPHIRLKNSETPFDESGLTPFEFAPRYEKGDSGAGVLAIKERLAALGYSVGEIDENFDDELEVAVNTFQKNTGLFPYGVMDITTQNMLENGIRTYKVVQDDQLAEAYNLLGDPQRMKELIESEPENKNLIPKTEDEEEEETLSEQESA